MTMDIATGIDLVKIARFREIHPSIRKRFLERVFTPRELQDCNGLETRLAGRFAAKEAAAKALGCGIGEVSWQEIEVENSSSGKPVLLLHGNAQDLARRSGWRKWSLSISHTDEEAIACVTALVFSE